MIILPTQKYAGRYRIQVFKGSLLLRELTFSNLILDSGLDQVATQTSFLLQCFFGTGETPPAYSDTTLESLLTSSDVQDSTGSVFTIVDSTTAYYRYLVTYHFATGAITKPVTEVGIGNAPDQLFSRAMVTDEAGVIAPLIILPDERIDVIYELRSYLNLTDFIISNDLESNELSVDSITTAYTIRLSNELTSPNINRGLVEVKNAIILYSGDIRDITTFPAGSTSGTVYNSLDTYTPGSFSATFRHEFAKSTSVYSGGIQAYEIKTNQCDYQVRVSPAVMKTSDHLFHVTASLSWGRHDP